MTRIYCFLSLILVCGTIHAQRSRFRPFYPIQENNGNPLRLKMVSIKNYDHSKIDKDMIRLKLAYPVDHEETDYMYYILGAYPPIDADIAQKTFDVILGEFEAMTSVYEIDETAVDVMGDTLQITLAADNKAIDFIYTFVYKEENRRFKEVNFDIHDYGLLQYLHADSLLKAHKLSEASNAFNSVEYPSHYFDALSVGTELMEAAYYWAKAEYKARNFVAADSLMTGAMVFYFNAEHLDITSTDAFSEGTYGWSKGQFRKWIPFWGECTYKAGDLENSIKINKHFIKLYQDLSGPYLYLANSYYDTQQFDKAKENYKAYVSLMKKYKRQKEIPVYVKKRM